MGSIYAPGNSGSSGSGGFFRDLVQRSAAPPAPTPPGNALLAKEQQATQRQAAGKNPSVTPAQIGSSLLRLLQPPKNPTLVAGKPVQGGPLLTPATLAAIMAPQLPKQVRAARAQAVKIAHPSPAHPPSLGQDVTGLLSGAFGFPQARTKYVPLAGRPADVAPHSYVANFAARIKALGNQRVGQWRVERLPNGFVRVDDTASGLVALYDPVKQTLHSGPHILPDLRRIATSRLANESGSLSPAAFLRDRSGPYQPRTITQNDLTQQLPTARSRITNVGERLVDKASVALQTTPHVKDLPGMRLLTSGERVAKAAGREQRIERVRAAAAQAEHLNTLKAVKAGSPEDVANFWYAQLPEPYRNAQGLGLVRGMQAGHLDYVTSGRALADLAAEERAVQAKLQPLTDMKEKGPLLQQLEDIRIARTDLPQQEQDAAASIAQLDKLIPVAPGANQSILNAVHALGGDRTRILIAAGRLHPERAAQRPGLLARALGLEPSGNAAYIGHRLPTPENARYPYVPSGGTGRVKSPKGMSENKLILAKTGRLRPSVHVAAEDWQAAQVFHQATVARDHLAQLGDPFTGRVPAGHALVNPKGVTVPAHMRNEELAQFQEGYEDVKAIRKQAEEIVKGFIATDPKGHQEMIRSALEHGMKTSDLRIVPDRLIDRYYSQFRALRSRGPAGKAYDGAIDAVATSIVFARLGYIPKNLAQNLIMAVPHQGAMLPVNAVRAAQAMADPQLRHFLQAEVGNTGATGALGREAMSRRALGKIATGVSRVADDPIRMSAFMHEAAAAGVISRVNPLLTEKDSASLLRLFTDPAQRPLLNDIRSRSVEAMADFSRLTPDQSRMARRFLIIPGWLMAGTRYPFHFALTHPVRSALLAYIALGEPGAPNELHFNHPINEYFHGQGYKQGIDTPMGRFRTNSLNPVTTPYDLALAAAGTIRGKTGPFDYTTPTIWDVAQPLAGSLVSGLQGQGWGRSGRRLVPGEQFIEQMLHPAATANYPEDATRLGRLKREFGVVPIRVNDIPTKQSKGAVGPSVYTPSGSGSQGSIYAPGNSGSSGSIYAPGG